MADRAIIYVRVSSEKQIENTSLAEQERVCSEWCRNQGIEVAKVFKEMGESAKTANRTQFQAAFSYLAQQPKGRITHLVVYKFDRFSRSIDEGAVYRLTLRRQGIQLASVSEPTDNSASGRFLSSIMLAVGELDNDVRAERAVGGMRSRVANGRYVFGPPAGYRPGTKDTASLVQCPTNAPLVKRLFELVAEGHRKSEALQRVSILGLRSNRGKVLTQESANRLLTSPIYTGLIQVKKWGQVVKGDFEPIVSQELFDKVQRVLSGKSPVAVPHSTDNEDFPLRGLVMCSQCLKPVTASTSKGGSGNLHSYYRCHRGRGHMNVRADKVEADFLDLLGRLAPRPEREKMLREVLSNGLA